VSGKTAETSPATEAGIAEALQFLLLWLPEGPWVLTAVALDRKYLEGRTFGPETTEGLLAWLRKQDGVSNIYFHVNTVLREVKTKASREDIAEVPWLHVDVDPRAGEDLPAEQARILELVQNPPGGLPLPTVTIYSGGGYQAFWRLEEPIAINGDLAKAMEAARYNKQLEIIFGADDCHNVDRIMRLPGTMNMPDAKKRAKGRTPVRATLVEFCSDRIYPITDFIAAAPRQAAAAEHEGFSAPVSISSNIARLASVDDLPDSISERVKIAIVQGLDPDNADRLPSRSEWLFWVVCELVRGGISDDTIYSIITDPDFGIAQSVIDKKSRMQAYALNQIRRARECAIDPWLLKLNEHFAVIGNLGGKCRVIEECYDPAFDRPKITKQSFEDFRNRYLNKKIEAGKDAKGKAVMRPVGGWWLEHEKRRQYESLVFSPEREVPGAYNLWRGFACDAKPGDCDLYLEHMLTNICAGNQEHFDYLFAWMATAVQRPARPGETAVVLRGRQGTGKSFFVKMFGSLFGRHFLQVSDVRYLAGNFNSHLRDCVVLFGDEAFYAGDKKHEATLKTLVTEETLMYEMKGVDSEAGPNYLHIFLASNSNWVVPAGDSERRFLVLDVADTQMQSKPYFAAIKSQMDAGGREALLHMLQTYPLETFEVRSAPKTRALVDQKIYSLGAEDSWWIGKLSEGALLGYHDGWHLEVSKSELFDNYVEHMHKIRRNFICNPAVLGRFLGRVVPGLHVTRKRFNRETGWGEKISRDENVYVMPPLAECRAHFEGLFGGSLGQW
jgi:hypothetical protein